MNAYNRHMDLKCAQCASDAKNSYDTALFLRLLIMSTELEMTGWNSLVTYFIFD